MDPLPTDEDDPNENESPRLSSIFSNCHIEELVIGTSSKYIGSTVVNPPRCSKQLLDVASQVKYGLLLSQSSNFQKKTTCVIPGPESALVDSLVEDLVPFQGSTLIDTTDLVSLRGCGPTSEEKYLSNFVIESYLELIAKQGVVSGRRVEFVGWERFEKLAGRQSVKHVLRGKSPLLEQDVFLVPCNTQESKHWFLLAVLPKEQEIMVLDSMAGAFVKPSAKEAISKMWMLLEELDPSIKASEWNVYIPQQQNGYDCGVYLRLYAKCLVLQHLATFRRSMVLELHWQHLQPFAS